MKPETMNLALSRIVLDREEAEDLTTFATPHERMDVTEARQALLRQRLEGYGITHLREEMLAVCQLGLDLDDTLDMLRIIHDFFEMTETPE